MNLLAYKSLEVGVISIHCMSDYFLDPHEFSTAETASHLDQVEFPTTYPMLNHPSTVFVVKHYSSESRSASVEFEPDSNFRVLKVQITIGCAEVILSHGQVKELARLLKLAEPKTCSQKEPTVDINLLNSTV